MKILCEVSVGELIDKMTILEIKSKKIKDKEKLENIKDELSAVKITVKTYDFSEEVFSLKKELKKINEHLWKIEDDIRAKEKKRKFDYEFVAIARSVYYKNDERFKIKNKINKACNSRFSEEKSYEEYEKGE